MNSRISAAEGHWFKAQAQSAPWHLVPDDADLADADPVEVDGLYDHALSLYNHFYAAAPKQVSVAKVSKVLHLMRPRLFPILDSRLIAFYSTQAENIALEVAKQRPEFGHKRMNWAAIRSDILRNRHPLVELRVALRQSEAPLASQVAERVGDVRLLDMLAWDASGQPEAT